MRRAAESPLETVDWGESDPVVGVAYGLVIPIWVPVDRARRFVDET